MQVALRGSYVEYVVFRGITEEYPKWFDKELDQMYLNEHRFTFYMPKEERYPDYHEKELVEEFSVFLRKFENDEVFLTNYDTFSELYTIFQYDLFTNSGIAAYKEDTIEYVECRGGILNDEYPNWFYEYFTEAINFPYENETVLFYDAWAKGLKVTEGTLFVRNNGDISVSTHCVFLRNRFGEIMGMEYIQFLKIYDPLPKQRRLFYEK
jgi:hypothetical protein